MRCGETLQMARLEGASPFAVVLGQGCTSDWHGVVELRRFVIDVDSLINLGGRLTWEEKKGGEMSRSSSFWRVSSLALGALDWSYGGDLSYCRAAPLNTEP